MTETQDTLRPRTDPRRHDLDALRAMAMLLGIALHAALSFVEIPWVVQDQSRAPAYGVFVMVVHGFRMPLFFLLSGFFTAMLWRRRGLSGLLSHRAKRIALPLALGCVTIVPAMWAVSMWAGSGNTTYGAADTGKDLWTAAAYGDLEAVRLHLARGASIDEPDPMFGITPLGWAVTADQPEAVAELLGAGADPSARYRDRNTPIHTAAFFGRAEAAALLLEAGANFNLQNTTRETPLDSMRHDRGTTEFIAGLLKLPIDFDEVAAGRTDIREMLASRGAVSGLNRSQGADPEMRELNSGSAKGGESRSFDGLTLLLMYFPFFHHLWFLWFLCWLVMGFAVVVLAAKVVPRLPLPRALVTSPLCLLWLVPLTMLTQAFMHSGGVMPGFGPDTSAGLIPIPHVLAHYAIFFGFGAMLYAWSGPASRLVQGWWLHLSLALLVLPVSLALAQQTDWGRELIADESVRRLLANLGQVLYAWLMIFGLIGLFETLLSRERWWVRYISDSAYWLYLVHLPLIIAGQALLRDVALPAWVKFTVLLVTATALLLASYRWIVRYTWLGTLLNGPRAKPIRDTRTASAAPDVQS